MPPDIDASDPALPVWARPATAVDSGAAGDENRVVGEVMKKGEIPKIRRVVTNVTLPVTVVDERQHPVANLKSTDFTVFENDQAQEIIKFNREDVPVSIGVLVDNSGSMREKRQKVSIAVLNLIKASNPNDEVFIVNFSDDAYLDQDFTRDLNLMHEALERLDSRGGTALYDGVIAASDHLAKAAKRDKRVLLVVTDGEDNESRNSLEQAIRAVQDENGPMIYTIGILGLEGKQHRAKRALEALSLQTGGVAFFPRNLEEVDAISQAVARDIRNQYSLTYKPSEQPTGYRRIKVVVRHSNSDLRARTKSGYFVSEQNTSATNK
ncbi:MAG TPA: VWA domain-containing protein [Candidatus Angelobacter sp.]